MPEQSGLNPADRELEIALSSLAPAAARIDAVGAAFEAGRRSARRQIRGWQSAAMILLLLSGTIWMVPRGGGQPVPTGGGQSNMFAIHTVEANREAHRLPRAAYPRSTASLATLQRAVREHNLNALPATELPAVRAVRVGETF